MGQTWIGFASLPSQTRRAAHVNVMQNSNMRRRSLEIRDFSAGRYFRRLESFLGREEIEKRLKQVEFEIRSATGAYLNYWVMPRMSWWLGFNEARAIIKRNDTFRRNLTQRMEYPLQTAVKLSAFHRSMPDFKKKEYSSRILSDSILEPTLFEIDCAAHFWQLGYDIEWIESRSDVGGKTPEFIAVRDEVQIEIECKSKRADAGRRIERRLFYRVVDNLLPIVQEFELMGSIQMVMPLRIPTNDSWHNTTKETFRKNIATGSKSITLSDGTIIELNLTPADGSTIYISDISKIYDLDSNPFAHYAIMGTWDSKSITNPIRFKLVSEKPDAFLNDVLESLRKAAVQFSGKRAAIISCVIPGIDSFVGLQDNSAIQIMTYHFFENYAAEFINAVSYVSDPIREFDGSVIMSDRPSLSFRNHKYSEKFGPDIPLY